MDPNGRHGAGQAPPPFSAAPPSPTRRVSSRLSTISDISDFSTFDAYQSAAVLQQPHLPPEPEPQPLRGRESLVSIRSYDDSAYTPYNPNVTSAPAPSALPPVSTAPLSLQYRAGSWMVASPSSYDSKSTPESPSSAGRYSPLSYTGPSVQRTPSKGLGRMFSRATHRLRGGSIHQTIPEEQSDNRRESIDMTSLVQNAAPMGSTSSSKPYAPLARQDPENRNGPDDGMSSFDVTGFLGPATSQDAAFIKSLQEQEASGKLTLGIGAGFGPATKLKESELFTPVTPSAGSLSFGSGGAGGPLSRAFSIRRPSSAAPSPLGTSFRSPITPTTHQLQRQGTVKALAQNEANRRGEIVEIIMEDDENDDDDDETGLAHHGFGSEVDLSVMAGPSVAQPMNPSARQQTILPARRQAAHVFYPQPNWKPFSMRWPYLLMLILLSAALGAAQEMIYRASQRSPLVRFHTPSKIPGFLFSVKFVLTIATVTYGVLWQVTDFEVRRLEAFYQLSQENGAVADESINVDYATSLMFFRPFRALYCKHYAVFVSSVTSLLAVSLVPTLGAASIVLQPGRDARQADPLGEKQVTIHAVFSRLLTATFALIALLGCVLFWLLQSRRSGLLSDVRGIAGLASMAVVSHIMTDFKDMDVATHKDIHRKLKDHRYVLRNSSLAPDNDNPASSQERERYKENALSQNPHPLMLRAGGCLPYIVCIVLFSGFIPVVLFTDANVVTERAAWLLTAMAVSIKLGWGGLETAIRMMEPYYILSRRHAPPKTLTLDYTAMPFLWVALQALRNGHLLVFFVSFGTVMTELLTVLVTSLATVQGRDFLEKAQGDNDGTDKDSGQETALSFWMSLGLVLFILVYMGAVALVAFLRRRRPFLPRQPNTIASVLAFIHQSKLLYSFVGTSKLSNAEMLQRLEKLDNTYGLGWFEGRDGQTHCGVDQEELISSYKVGYDYSKANQPWIDRPVEWL